MVRCYARTKKRFVPVVIAKDDNACSLQLFVSGRKEIMHFVILRQQTDQQMLVT